MAVKIPQDVRERQLRELAEADGYTFVGWVDAVYTGTKSKAIIRCILHGEWSVRLCAFISQGQRCPGCCGVRSEGDNKKLLTDKIAEAGYGFIGWEDDYRGTKTRARLSCPAHGYWVSGFGNVMRGNGCPHCARVNHSYYKQIPDDELIHRINEAGRMAAFPFSFVRFVGEGKGHNRQIECFCVVHGLFPHRSTNILRSPGCVKCSGIYNASEYEVFERLVGLDIGIIKFEGRWKGTNKTKAICECRRHGLWYAKITNIEQGSRCPSCAENGYRPANHGTLYSLLSDCGSMVKIGISNKPDRRHAELNRATPFKFTVYRTIHCEDGSIPPILEKQFHDAFPSAGLSGFDGATEWRLWHDDVNTWFDLLSG